MVWQLFKMGPPKPPGTHATSRTFLFSTPNAHITGGGGADTSNLVRVHLLRIDIERPEGKLNSKSGAGEGRVVPLPRLRRGADELLVDELVGGQQTHLARG